MVRVLLRFDNIFQIYSYAREVHISQCQWSNPEQYVYIHHVVWVCNDYVVNATLKTLLHIGFVEDKFVHISGSTATVWMQNKHMGQGSILGSNPLLWERFQWFPCLYENIYSKIKAYFSCFFSHNNPMYWFCTWVFSTIIDKKIKEYVNLTEKITTSSSVHKVSVSNISDITSLRCINIS